jgi:DNA polymerase (family 10)
MLEMLTIPGLGPYKVLKLHKDLGINTVKELEAACRQDKLKGVRGLGPALQRKILAGLQARKSFEDKRHMHRAADLLESAKESLKTSPLRLGKIEIAGDLRRGYELVGNLSLVAEKTDSNTSPLQFGDLTVHVADPRRFGAVWLFATGSKAHLTQLQSVARKKGLSLERDGLYRNGKLVAARSEEDIYEAWDWRLLSPSFAKVVTKSLWRDSARYRVS